MAWIEPIYDRSVSDVEYALQKIKELRNSGATNTTDLKRCFNVSDMNRIEGNIRYLADALTDLYYFNDIVTKTWERDDVPTESDITRVIENTRSLVLSFSEHAPDLPTTLLTITDVNCIEETLNRVKMILDGMITSFQECDTFECGEG
jgi:hypothetical protein